MTIWQHEPVRAAEMSWNDHQEWESAWWGTCVNTFCEETKQISYAHRMGLVNTPQGEFWPVYDVRGQAILDLGGGPASMLLKTINARRMTVVDPGVYPDWITERYAAHGVDYMRMPAEQFSRSDVAPLYDECWIYNVLQHVIDPALVLATARREARVLRIYEWVDIPACPGHPHVLRREWLDTVLQGTGTIEQMHENGCYGTAYYGVFQS